MALHEVAQIYLAMRDHENVQKTGREALKLLASDKVKGATKAQVKVLRSMVQSCFIDEDKMDLKTAAKLAKECSDLGSAGGADVQAYGKLWTARVNAEKFFENYIPRITLWNTPGYKGKRNEKDLKLKDYDKAMKLIDEAYLAFEKLEDEAGMQEAFNTAYTIQQKTNKTQEPAKTIHIFKNGQYDHTEYSYDYAEVKRELEEKKKNADAALVE